MKAYRHTTNLKLGLIVLAVLLALGSLIYTHGLVQRLREHEKAGMEIWAGVREQVAMGVQNPHVEALQQLEILVLEQRLATSDYDISELREALVWAGRMPQNDEHMGFFVDVITDYYNDVPAIITDENGTPLRWHNLSVSDTSALTPADSQRVLDHLAHMAEIYEPIPIEVGADGGDGELLRQFVYYDESEVIQELRIYPYIQLLFVGLFVMLGYLGFSYLRRNEQSNLWVGMAREAAHQLGTPISSLMGWLELLRQEGLLDGERKEALEEMEKDVDRLSRVAHRFNDIGSSPKLVPMEIAPVIMGTAEYIKRRFPERGLVLGVEVPADVYVRLNMQLFEWVVENLLKNALDAMEKLEGRIHIVAVVERGSINIDVIDNGKGVDRRQWKNIFRPGYSTKKRGWGLGLSLAKRIVEEYHGGRLILFSSRPGRGSTFRIMLPIVD